VFAGCSDILKTACQILKVRMLESAY
jgi:hypothetical protein